MRAGQGVSWKAGTGGMESRLEAKVAGPVTRSRSLLVPGVIGLTGLAVLVPLATVLWMTFTTGLPGTGGPLSLANYREVYGDIYTYRVIYNSLGFAAITVGIVMFFALPMAWLTERTDLPWKTLWLVLLGVNVAVPVLMKAMGWIFLLSPEIGILNQILMSLFGLEEAPLNIYNLAGMGFVQGLSLVPLAYFMLAPMVRAIDSSLEEAAHIAGLGKLRTLRRIILPISLPGILAVAIYIVGTAIAVFEVPAIIGFPQRIFVLSSAIYDATNPEQFMPQYGLAATYGMTILAVGVVAATFYLRVLKQSHKYAVVTGKGYRVALLGLGRWKGLALLFVGSYFALSIFVPFATLVWTSLLPYFQRPSLEMLGMLSLDNYAGALQLIGWRPFINTAFLMGVVPAVTVLVSMILSWFVVTQKAAGREVIDTLTFVPHVIPHIVLALGLGYGALVLDLPIYGSIFLIAIGHIIIFLPFTTRSLNNALIQIHPELQEAGKVCGLPPLRVLRRIVAPMVARALFFTLLYTSLLVYREVTLALMLGSPDNTVLSTALWSLWLSGFLPDASALAVILILAMGALVFLAGKMFGFERAGV